MAIDIRATVTCSLGTLISGSISDDYIQGSGLVKTRGSVEISALITPAIGTAVTFSYTKGGVTRSIPRKLRVMSSFADPFRRTTTVELGCKLTYLSDYRPAPTVDGEPTAETGKRQQCLNGYIEYPSNSSYGIPISASGLLTTCCQRLGITASSNPLTNRFFRDSFDFSSGYVSVLNDLLVSESYFGYLDTNEVLQIVNLDQNSGTGPVFTSADIVDLGPIGVGGLPGDAVVVRYEAMVIKEDLEEEDPEILNQRNWEEDEVIGQQQTVEVRYTSSDGAVYSAYYSYIPYSKTTTEYGEDDSWDDTTCVIIDTNGKGADLSNSVVKRTTRQLVLKAQEANDYCAQLFAGGFNPDPSQTGELITEELYEYDSSGQVTRQTTNTYEPYFMWAGRINMQFIYEDQAVILGASSVLTRQVIQETTTLYAQLPQYIDLSPGETYEKLVNGQKVVTTIYENWVRTQQGQQAVAGTNQNAPFENAAQCASYLLAVSSRMVLIDNTVQTSSNRILMGIEKRPQAQLRLGLNGNNYRGEFKAQLTYASGSPLSTRIIEMSMPLQSDDYYSATGTIIKGDAPAKAMRYGRVQNRLLLGNRSGINLQLAPEKLPAAPYSPLYVQASGLTALYRANGTNWAFDSNGIVCSVDALFWAAVGGTGTFWFPVAPGIATLPAEPPIVDGAMNPSTTVLPYNETAIYDSLIRLTPVVSKFDYSLTLLTAAVSTIKIKTVVQKVIVGAAGTFNLTGQAALFASNRILGAAAGAFALAGQDALFSPAILTGEAGGFTVSGQTASFIKSISVLTGTQAPLLGATSAVSFTGWTRIQNATADDEFIQVSGWPFTFTLASTGYTSTFVGSNTYLTFGSGATDYSGLGASVPNLPKILFGSDDNSYQRVYTKADIAEDGSNVMRIRYEGQAATTGTPGSSNIIAEFAFYAARPNGDQWIELRVGSHNRTSGPFMIASATTSYASSTITANSSWVFVGNSTGTSWTLTSNRYIG